MPYNDRYPFRDRCRIQGTLRTVSPLHIGDGDQIHEALRRNPALQLTENQREEGPYIATVARDVDGHPCIPGSSLKGSMHAWLERRLGGDELSALFGAESNGGPAEFWDARIIAPPPDFDPGQDWNATRLTSVARRAAIDRRYRKTSYRKLFQCEFVPPGIGFTVDICGVGLTTRQVGILLAALAGCADPDDPLTLGSETGGGFGRLQWTTRGVQRLDRAAAPAWLAAGNRGYENLPDAPRPVVVLPDPPATLTFDITLKFETPFLVNDASRTGGKGQPAFTPLLRRNPQGVGEAYLPATAFRGAFRARFERIARTLGLLAAYPDQDSYPDNFTVHKKNELTQKFRRCVASPLFGAPGWKAPLAIGDFTPFAGASMYLADQEFVAIDRFTGGSAPELKFNGTAAHNAVFTGRLSLDLARLAMAGAHQRTLELLAYTLRDLAEGDITFGYGAAKGYGVATAKIVIANLPPNPQAAGLGWFKRWIDPPVWSAASEPLP